jgi:hypothetical protein
MLGFSSSFLDPPHSAARSDRGGSVTLAYRLTPSFPGAQTWHPAIVRVDHAGQNRWNDRRDAAAQ